MRDCNSRVHARISWMRPPSRSSPVRLRHDTAGWWHAALRLRWSAAPSATSRQTDGAGGENRATGRARPSSRLRLSSRTSVHVGGMLVRRRRGVRRPASRIERDDVYRGPPRSSRYCASAHQPRGGEFLDVADAAAHLQRFAQTFAHRRQRGISRSASDAQVGRRGPGCRPRRGRARRREQTHRQRLLGLRHDLHQFPPRRGKKIIIRSMMRSFRTPRDFAPPSSRT